MIWTLSEDLCWEVKKYHRNHFLEPSKICLQVHMRKFIDFSSPLLRKPSMKLFFSCRFSIMSKTLSEYLQLAVKKTCYLSLPLGSMVKFGKESPILSNFIIFVLSLKLSDRTQCSYLPCLSSLYSGLISQNLEKHKGRVSRL